MLQYIISFINILFDVVILAIIVNVILSYFMSPFHPLKMTLDRIVNPMLAPIRRVIPPVANLDLSPLVLLILLQVLQYLLVRLLIAVFL